MLQGKDSWFVRFFFLWCLALDYEEDEGDEDDGLEDVVCAVCGTDFQCTNEEEVFRS